MKLRILIGLLFIFLLGVKVYALPDPSDSGEAIELVSESSSDYSINLVYDVDFPVPIIKSVGSIAVKKKSDDFPLPFYSINMVTDESLFYRMDELPIYNKYKRISSNYVRYRQNKYLSHKTKTRLIYAPMNC